LVLNYNLPTSALSLGADIPALILTHITHSNTWGRLMLSGCFIQNCSISYSAAVHTTSTCRARDHAARAFKL